MPTHQALSIHAPSIKVDFSKIFALQCRKTYLSCLDYINTIYIYIYNSYTGQDISAQAINTRHIYLVNLVVACWRMKKKQTGWLKNIPAPTWQLRRRQWITNNEEILSGRLSTAKEITQGNNHSSPHLHLLDIREWWRTIKKEVDLFCPKKRNRPATKTASLKHTCTTKKDEERRTRVDSMLVDGWGTRRDKQAPTPQPKTHSLFLVDGWRIGTRASIYSIY